MKELESPLGLARAACGSARTMCLLDSRRVYAAARRYPEAMNAKKKPRNGSRTEIDRKPEEKVVSASEEAAVGPTEEAVAEKKRKNKKKECSWSRHTSSRIQAHFSPLASALTRLSAHGIRSSSNAQVVYILHALSSQTHFITASYMHQTIYHEIAVFCRVELPRSNGGSTLFCTRVDHYSFALDSIAFNTSSFADPGY